MRVVNKLTTRRYIVMGPDIHGPSVYFRSAKLSRARRFSRGMEKHWTILRIVHAGRDLLSEAKAYRPKRRPNGDQEY